MRTDFWLRERYGIKLKNVLIINPILYTAETNRIPKADSIKDTMIYTMCRGFLKAGHQVTLIAAEDYRPQREEVYPFPVIWMKTVWHKVFQPRCLPYMPELRKYLRQHKEYDLIISSEMFATWSYTAARVCPDKTLVWHELAAHNQILHRLPSVIWYNLVVRLCMRRVTVVPRSEAAAVFIKQFSDRVANTIIDHGVDLDKFPIDKPLQKKKQFVVVSQLIERKRIDKTILAFADFISKGNEEFRLYLIGDGEKEQELRDLVSVKGLEDHVIFCGRMAHEQLMPIVAKSRAMLVSTVKDNNMVSIVESIAVGTPIVTTSVPYNAAYIKRKRLGIVEDDWSAEALSQIVRENSEYVQNCIDYRDSLSNIYGAECFIGLANLIFR